MLAKERHAAITELVKTNHIVFIGELAKRFDTSLETARRDLETLQDQGIVRRIHGGAVLSDTYPPSALTAQEENSYPQKKAIGRTAASLVSDGDTIFLAIGSTIREMAFYLKNKKELTVITNSILVINELINTDVKVIVLGGVLNNNEEMIYSYSTEQMLEQYYVDKAFFSCGGIFQNNITDYGETLDRYKLAQHSKKMILLADSRKFGRTAKIKSCSFDIVDTVVVDTEINSQYLDYLQHQKINILLASTDEQENIT